jgi:hypothetical protein
MFMRILTLTVLCAYNVLAQGSKPSLGSDGFIRFGCSQLVVERTDPLVTPGMNPSPHMQYVHRSYNIFDLVEEACSVIVFLQGLVQD